MKKIYLILLTLAFVGSAQAQTFPNASFETWRSGSAGSGTYAKIATAPGSWYGSDSLIVALGHAYGSIFMINDSVWRTQLYKDSGSNAHSGTYAAKLVTKDQDTLGIFPGVLSNAEPHVIISFTSNPPFTFYNTGGTHITYRVKTVSAWVKYTQGGTGDSGVLSVQVLGRYGSKPDSVMGTGFVTIGPSTAFSQVTANILYNVPDSLVDTLRVTFTSSKGGAASKVNSTLYVDDVSMTGSPFSVGELSAAGKLVSVYPNPANNILQLDVNSNDDLTCNIISVTGQVVASKKFTGNTTMDISTVAAGFYFYSITDANGNTAQTGNVSILR